MEGHKGPAVRTAVRKRPAAFVEQPALYEPPLPCHMVPAAKPPQEWKQPSQTISLPRPAWESHLVRVLQQHGHLPSTRMERALELTVWSDCSGINSEMFALREIRTALEHSIGVSVQFKLYFTCDSDKKCLKFANLNHHPKHTSTAMEQRNFETGKIWCETHKENHDLPKQGVDLYVGTYPCSPWSRRGKRTGFDHPDAQAFFIGLHTIVFLAPAVWIIEIGEVPSTAGMTEITQRVQEVIHNGRVTYTIQTVQSLSPAWCGYPVRRTRLFICGWRQDIGTDTVTEPLKCLIAAPLSVDCSFLAFLGLSGVVDWTRVGEYPSSDEMALLAASGCTCGLDPMSPCAVHACKCNKCGECGTGCSWRGLLVNFVAKEGLAPVVRGNASTLTYLQVLEMRGRRGPDNPRMRVLINLMAHMAEARPLSDTLMVADISQNPPYCKGHCQGDVPTLTTSSTMWCFQAGQFLSVHHLAALMGLDMSAVSFDESMGEVWFRQRLGLAVHIANFGLVLLAALSPPLLRCMS